MFPIQITFRDMDPIHAIEALIHERAEHLRRFHGRITACRVVIEGPSGGNRGTQPYVVKVDVSVPGGELVASNGHDPDDARADLPTAVRNAFEGITRRVQDHVSRRRDRKSMPGPG